MNETNKTARLAGVLYLLLTLTGLFNLIYTPTKLIVRGNASETAGNILAHQSLFRIDIVVSVFSTLIFLFLALVLYRLLKEVDRRYAAVMAILVLVQIPQAFVSQLLQVGAFELIRGPNFLSAFDTPQRNALAMLCFHLNYLGTHLSEMLWGIWLFPLGILVYRSPFLPRFLGLWLIINCFAYVLQSLTGLLLPDYSELVTKVTFPALLGEVAFMLWLLIKGAGTKPRVSEAS